MITAKRYFKAAARKEKTKILDEYCATLGCNRKYAINKFRIINYVGPPGQRKNRKRLYSGEADAAVIKIWETLGCICAERVYPQISESIRILEKFGHIKLSDSVKEELLSMSRATIGRRIMSHEKRFGRGKGLSTTKPGSLLKKHIPIQTQCWNTNIAGFIEMDTVAHCGESLNGEFINTLQMVDIETTWTERKAVMGKSQHSILDAIKKAGTQFPFVIRGLDSDNGSEFINHLLLNYCKSKGIMFTRSRPYMKKDNAHIEQKNWTLVRKVLGYDRFDTQHQLMLINDLYDNELRQFINFFQPTLKLSSKERFGARVIKKYAPAKTPYQRVLDSADVPSEKKEELKALYATLDPVKLRRNIDKKIGIIISLVRLGF